jgi:hypothetical protein
MTILFVQIDLTQFVQHIDMTKICRVWHIERLTFAELRQIQRILDIEHSIAYLGTHLECSLSHDENT